MYLLNNFKNYRVQFVSLTSDDWKCSKCELFVNKIWRINQLSFNNLSIDKKLKSNFKHKCNHQFCQSCVDKLIVNVKSIKCPLDSVVTQKKEWIEDRLNSEFILNQQVFCFYKDHGCRKILTLRELETHEKNCAYRLVNCPLKCGEIVTSKLLSKHLNVNCLLRSTNCTLCNENMSYQQKKNHELNCHETFKNCEFCSKKITIERLQDHYQQCLIKPKNCKFSSIGCRFQAKKEEVESHEKKLDNHLYLIVDRLIRDDNDSENIKIQLGELIVMVKQLNEENSHLKKCLKKFKNELNELKSVNKMMDEKISNVQLNHHIEISSLKRNHDLLRSEFRNLTEPLFEERQV